MHYHDSDDLKLLKELKTLAPVEFKTFVEFDSIVGKEDGAIPRKYRELMAIAVAFRNSRSAPIASTSTPGTPRRRARPARKSRKPYSSPRRFAPGAAATRHLALKLFDRP